MHIHELFSIVQIDCIITTLLCTHKLNKIVKRMGLLDFLFAGAVFNSVKKARHNDSQQTLHGRVSDYDHVYEDGYDDSCYEHGYHEDCDCHDTYDCAGYNDDCCENDCNW